MIVIMAMVVMRGMRLGARAQHVLTRRKRVHARPLERILRLEETAIHRKRALQIKGTDIKNLCNGHIGVTGAENPRCAIHRTDAPLDPLEIGFTDQISFVEQDDVGESHLLCRLIHLLEMTLDMTSIDEGDDGIKHELRLELIVQEKSLRYRAGIGHARRLDDDVVELVATLEQLPKDAQQVAAYRAADAAVVGLEDFFFGADDELVVDANLTELVFDDGDALAVLLRQDAIQQSGLSRPQKARQYGDGDPIRGSHKPRMIT